MSELSLCWPMMWQSFVLTHSLSLFVLTSKSKGNGNFDANQRFEPSQKHNIYFIIVKFMFDVLYPLLLI